MTAAVTYPSPCRRMSYPSRPLLRMPCDQSVVAPDDKKRLQDRLSQPGQAVYHNGSSLGLVRCETEAGLSSTVFSRILIVKVCRRLYPTPGPSIGCLPYRSRWECILKKRTISAEASGPLGSV
jgi:hypothetical protein